MLLGVKRWVCLRKLFKSKGKVRWFLGSRMRSNIALYIVAGLFFVLAFVSVFMYTETMRILFVASTVVLGVLSCGLGYYQKLKKKNYV